MRILIVNKFLYPNGGSETYIFKIGQQLQKMGHEVQYFGMEHEGRIVGNSAGIYTDDMSFHGGNKAGKLLYPFKIIYSFEARKKIRQVLDDFKPDVVHLNNINFQITPSIIDEIRCKKIRIIYTAHDYQWVCPNHMLMIPSTGEMCTRCIDGDYGNCSRNRCIHGSKLRSILGTIEARLYDHRKTYSFVEAVIAPSFFMKKELSHNRNIADDKIVVLHNFVDIEDSTPAVGGSADTRRTAFDNTAVGSAYTGDNSEKYVLYFGRYDAQKGVKTLIKVCRELPDIHFVFAGKGELKAGIDEVSNIADKGFLSGKELTKLIAGAEFTVFTSECYENCPFSVIESQMYGTPVIGSDLGGTPELIQDGVTGEIFKAGNAEELKAKIRALYDDEQRIALYRENCSTKLSYDSENAIYSLEDYCRRLVEIYNDTHKCDCKK